MPYLSSSGPHHNSPLSSTPTSIRRQVDQPYMLHYHDRDDCEQHMTCASIYDALVWAREEAQEHASKVCIYQLCHVELAP